MLPFPHLFPGSRRPVRLALAAAALALALAGCGGG
ncbi:MAG: hypothetical protein RL456_427, partial [Pseudomonadota bacterium]